MEQGHKTPVWKYQYSPEKNFLHLNLGSNYTQSFKTFK